MTTFLINETVAHEKKNHIINVIEAQSGWFIEWTREYVKLQADTEERLEQLKEFFSAVTLWKTK